ncbi:MAG: hypothetical protein ACRC3B_08425, partial [Bacteroidia bacterium]
MAVFTLLLCLTVQSQTVSSSAASECGQYPCKILRIDPVRFLIREPNIGIEWRNSIRHSSEIRIGYIYPQPAMMWLYE